MHAKQRENFLVCETGKHTPTRLAYSLLNAPCLGTAPASIASSQLLRMTLTSYCNLYFSFLPTFIFSFRGACRLGWKSHIIVVVVDIGIVVVAAAVVTDAVVDVVVMRQLQVWNILKKTLVVLSFDSTHVQMPIYPRQDRLYYCPQVVCASSHMHIRSTFSSSFHLVSCNKNSSGSIRDRVLTIGRNHVHTDGIHGFQLAQQRDPCLKHWAAIFAHSCGVQVLALRNGFGAVTCIGRFDTVGILHCLTRFYLRTSFWIFFSLVL